MSRSRTAAARALDVVVADGRGRRLRRKALAGWLEDVAPARARGWVGIAIVSDRQARSLNRRYRRVDRATDVLSFPATSNAEPRSVSSRDPFLGDIVIARGVARRQAHEAGHSELTELRVLALHGLLHLLGYDHERDNGRMERLERRLRRRGRLAQGLIERERRSR